MLFRELCEIFFKLDQTSGRKDMSEILADLLYRLSQEEIEYAVYLSLGKLGPDYNQLPLGIKEKLAVQILSAATGVSEKELNDKFKTTGDLGDLAHTASKSGRQTSIDDFLNPSTTSRELSIIDVWQNLLQIAKVGGKDSAGAKKRLASSIVKDMENIELKYYFRILIAKTRLGAKEATWLDACAIVLGDKQYKADLELAYNLTSDVGLVVATAMKKDIALIRQICRITLGAPVKCMLAQRIASADELFARYSGTWYSESKFDGYRVQLHVGEEITLWSRNQEQYTSQFPDLVLAAQQYIPKGTVIEGEIVAYNYSSNTILGFQELTKRSRKYNIASMVDEVPVKIFAFDILLHNNKEVFQFPYLQRRKLLKSVVKSNPVIEIVGTTTCRIVEDVESELIKAKDAKYEGIMLKRIDDEAIYEPGKRSFYWIKYKADYTSALADTFDLVILGGFAGKGKRAGWYGTMLMGAYDPLTDQYLTFCKLGAGFNEEDLENLSQRMKANELYNKPDNYVIDASIKPDIWVEPIIIIEVAAAEISASPVHTVPSLDGGNLALRFPRYTGRERVDKNLPTTVDEIQAIAQSFFIGGKR